MTVVFDAARGVVYLGADALGGFLPADAGWVSIDVRALADQSGHDLGVLTGTLGVDPTDIALSLIDTDDAIEVGPEVIDGVDTRHYTVSVDGAAALAALPQDELDLALADAGLPDPSSTTCGSRPTTNSVASRSTPRSRDRPCTMQLDLTTSSDPLGIGIPDASTVFDLTRLLGF